MSNKNKLTHRKKSMVVNTVWRRWSGEQVDHVQRVQASNYKMIVF